MAPAAFSGHFLRALTWCYGGRGIVATNLSINLKWISGWDLTDISTDATGTGK
jgi:hypothetical protein